MKYYYPICIPTLNRFEHFRNCVESLSQCTHADKTELVIGLDYPPSEKYKSGYAKILEYISTIEGFACITVFKHEYNLGPSGNAAYIINYCMSHYDAYIITEDDNVFAPAFLDYMNKALELFKDNEDIVSVSGYNFEDAYNQGVFNCYLSKDNCAWGTGYWKHKNEKLQLIINDISFFSQVLNRRKDAKKIMNTYPALYGMLDSMIKKGVRWGDVMRTTINIISSKYQLKPAISLVRNCGYDGSGIHCGNIDEFGLSRQKISDSFFFNFDQGVGPADTETNRIALYYHGLHKDVEERNKQLIHLKRIYVSNIWPCYYQIREKYYMLRGRFGIRTRLKKYLALFFK